jgi:hypothetical protein
MKLLFIDHFGMTYTTHLTQDFKFEYFLGKNSGNLACFNKELEVAT